MSEKIEKLWYKAARKIVKAGQLPMVVSNTLIKLLKMILTEEEAKFILVFKKPSMNINEIRKNIDLDEMVLNEVLNRLMNKGVVVGIPSRRSGLMVYRLLGPFPGLFEMQFMRGENGEDKKLLAQLFDKIFDELSEGTQRNYDHIVSQFKNFPPITRVVPVEEEIEEIPVDTILPFEEVSKIVEKYKDIAVVHCYCRHEKDLLNKSCDVTKERENCFLFGKSAQFAIQHNFGRPISQDDAKRIINRASDEGLVHKAFHVHLKPDLDEEAICNCCRCCCGIFSLYWRGIMPYHCFTSYLAEVIGEKCIGCGTCEEKCPLEAISMLDGITELNKSRCIGCGICVHHCPNEAIRLKRTGNREVFIPPPKIKT